MLISKTLLTWAVGFGVAAVTQALTPMQVTFQNEKYKQEGFQVFSSSTVEGYSLRLKQPKTCEPGIQVK